MVIFQYNLYIFGSIFEPCYIQNHVIMNCVIKRLKCICFYGEVRKVSIFLFEKTCPIWDIVTFSHAFNLGVQQHLQNQVNIIVHLCFEMK